MEQVSEVVFDFNKWRELGIDFNTEVKKPTQIFNSILCEKKKLITFLNGISKEDITEEEQKLLSLINFFIQGKRYSALNFLGLDDKSKNIQIIAKLFLIYRENNFDVMFRKLKSIYTDFLWTKNKSGSKFSVNSKFDFDEFDFSGLYGFEKSNPFIIFWYKEDSITSEYNDGVTYHLRTFAKSLIVKFSNDFKELEIRGQDSQRSILLEKHLREKLDLGELEEDEKDFSFINIKDKIISETKLSQDNLLLTGIEFNNSLMPNKSAFSLDNAIGVETDLNDLVMLGKVSLDSISNIKQLKFKFNEINSTHIIRLDSRANGFLFRLYDGRVNDRNRAIIKETLEKIGISLNKVYYFDVVNETEKKILFNKCLELDVNYYKQNKELNPDADIFTEIEKYVSIKEEETYKCRGPNCKFESEEKIEECPDCGFEKFSQIPSSSLKLNKDKLVDDIFAKFNLLDKERFYTIGNFRYSIESISKEVSQAKKSKGESSIIVKLKNIDLDYFEKVVFLFDDGSKQKIPMKYEEYGIKTVFVTFGNVLNNKFLYKKNGVINTYDILNSSIGSFMSDFLDTIEKTKQNYSSIIDDFSREALERLEFLDKCSKEDNFDLIKEEYLAKHFERDIFFLIKRMFNKSDRLGKEGVRETDGFLNLIHYENNEAKYNIFSYDTKLSYDIQEGHYNFSIGEKDKTFFYILGPNFKDKSLLEYTSKKGIRTHIIISNYLNKNDTNIESIYQHYNEYFRLFTDDEDKKSKFLYFELDALIYLFKYYLEIQEKETHQIGNDFNSYVYEMLYSKVDNCGRIRIEIIKEIIRKPIDESLENIKELNVKY